MRPKRPAGGDVPPEFLGKGQFSEKPSEKLLQTNVDIARHNLQVKLAWFKKETFRVAKEVALEGKEENIRQMDKYVRSVFADEPSKMAEWEELMSRYEFMDETLE